MAYYYDERNSANYEHDLQRGHSDDVCLDVSLIFNTPGGEGLSVEHMGSAEISKVGHGIL